MFDFDSAATTLQKPASVPAAVAKAISTMTTPGRGDHPAARAAAELMLGLRTEERHPHHERYPRAEPCHQEPGFPGGYGGHLRL